MTNDAHLFHDNNGQGMLVKSRWDTAIESFREIVAHCPESLDAHVNLANALLLTGQMREGFQEYEWRLKAQDQRFNGRDPWGGMVDPEATLLVLADGGLNEVVMLVRYLPFIGAQGMRVIVQCPEALQGVFQAIEGISMAYAENETLPEFDEYIALSSLPYLFQTDLSRIPDNVPYIHASFGKMQKWQQRISEYGENVRIGLAWHGVGTQAGVPLEIFEPLAELERVTFFALNLTPVQEEDKASAQKLGLVDLSSEIEGWEDFLALAEHVNLLIAPDILPLHLVGALKRPAWAMLEDVPAWPWMVERSDSPWYPSLRLFRQEHAGDWEGVASEVSRVLRDVMATI